MTKKQFLKKWNSANTDKEKLDIWKELFDVTDEQEDNMLDIICSIHKTHPHIKTKLIEINEKIEEMESKNDDEEKKQTFNPSKSIHKTGNPLSPNDFYFSVVDSKNDWERYIGVCLRETWDRDGYWNDEYEFLADDLMEELGYISLAECMYEYLEFPDNVRGQLTEAGFVENNDISGDSK